MDYLVYNDAPHSGRRLLGKIPIQSRPIGSQLQLPHFVSIGWTYVLSTHTPKSLATLSTAGILLADLR